MPRSRRFLVFCTLVAVLAWTNVQAMTCCWSAGLLPVERAHGDGHDGTQAFASAPEPAPASCHGPAPTPDAADDDAPSGPASPSSGCGDFLNTVNTASTTASCCDAPAPAESFSAVLRLEALPPGAFYAAPLPPRAAVFGVDEHPLHAPGSPRFLALERLLI